MDTEGQESVDWTPLKEQLYKQTEHETDGSGRWLWWNFLDELTSGYLVYDVMLGHLDPRVLIEHAFWIIGHCNGIAEYNSFAFKPWNDMIAIHYALREFIENMSDGVIECNDALEHLKTLDRQSLAGLSYGQDDDGNSCIILYYNPIIEDFEALGHLAHTARIDVEAQKTRSW